MSGIDFKGLFLNQLKPAVIMGLEERLAKGELKEGQVIDVRSDLKAIKAQITSNPTTSVVWEQLKITDEDMLKIMREAADEAGLVCST